jgi:predicted metal-dependent peptidase
MTYVTEPDSHNHPPEEELEEFIDEEDIDWDDEEDDWNDPDWDDDEEDEDWVPAERVENTSKTWESTDFRDLVERLTDNDKRFVGIFGFLKDVRFCWSYQIKTACAGYGFIFFNPDWYDMLPEETHKTVIYHEAMHLILRHLQRGESCDPYIYGLAIDFVVNLDAKNHGFTFEGWQGPCLDDKYAGMSSEDVYDQLMDGNKYEPLNIDFSKHISRELIEEMIKGVLGDLSFEDQKDYAEHKVKQQASKGCGSGMGHIGLQFDLMKRKVAIQGASYEEIFAKQMTEPEVQKKRTFKRPSRRMSTDRTQPFILPGRMKTKSAAKRLSHLIWCLDVSGSISTAQGKQFNDGAQTAKALLNPEKMTVIFWDTAIRHIQTFTDKEPYKRMKVRAGGGTNLGPVYAKLRELEAETVVIFTDLCVTIPPEPDWDTIWLLTSENDTVPASLYGDVYICPPLESPS